MLIASPQLVGAQQSTPAPTEPGSPVAITNVAGYTETTTRYGIATSSSKLTCISFENVSNRTLTSVTFELSNRLADGTPVDVKLLKRDGTFSPGIEIRGYQGEKVGTPDSHAIANCPAFTPLRGGGVHPMIRVLEATFDDGTTWKSSLGVAAAPAPKPTAVVEADAPPWDATRHQGYIAVLTAGPSAASRDPQKVLIYAPGHRGASAMLTFERCCVQAIAFDAAGNLLAATMNRNTGIEVYAPGARAATRTLPQHDGFALAHDAAGDLAIGGYNSGPDVAVYPAHGAGYRVPGQPVSRGLALSPSGELAMLEFRTRTIRTFAPGSATAAREIPFEVAPATPAPAAAPPAPIGSVAYDRDGRLGVLDVMHGTLRVFDRGATEPAFAGTVRGAVMAAFDDAGRLYALTRTSVVRFSRTGGTPETVLTRGGTSFAVDGAGRVVLMDSTRQEIVVPGDAGAPDTVVPIGAVPRALAISP